MVEFILDQKGTLDLEVETNKMTYKKTFKLEDYPTLEAMFSAAQKWYDERSNYDNE